MTRLQNLTVGLLALFISSPALADTLACASSGADAPLALHKHWIMEGWEKREGDAEFVFADKMARYYDLENPAGVFYDNFAPGESQLFDNGAIYGANWEGLQAGARSVLHALTEGHSELLGQRISSTTLGFVGTIDRLDGSVIPFKGRSQLGWECDEGAWKIRQELNYAWIVEADTIQAYYDALKKNDE